MLTNTFQNFRQYRLESSQLISALRLSRDAMQKTGSKLELNTNTNFDNTNINRY